jgi:hypothetical protein
MIYPHNDSKWTHNICHACYHREEPGRIPATLKDDEMQTCCFCGNNTRAGIYYRKDPELVHPT